MCISLSLYIYDIYQYRDRERERDHQDLPPPPTYEEDVANASPLCPLALPHPACDFCALTFQESRFLQEATRDICLIMNFRFQWSFVRFYFLQYSASKHQQSQSRKWQYTPTHPYVPLSTLRRTHLAAYQIWNRGILPIGGQPHTIHVSHSQRF